MLAELYHDADDDSSDRDDPNAPFAPRAGKSAKSADSTKSIEPSAQQPKLLRRRLEPLTSLGSVTESKITPDDAPDWDPDEMRLPEAEGDDYPVSLAEYRDKRDQAPQTVDVPWRLFRER